jgi:hypothetical protein
VAVTDRIWPGDCCTPYCVDPTVVFQELKYT